MSSSKFSSPFFKKSPLLGAYTSGADAVFAPSDAEHFSKLSNDILGATMAAMNPKSSKCEEIRENWHNNKMTDKAYADASKDCAQGVEIDYSDLSNKNSYYYDYNE